MHDPQNDQEFEFSATVTLTLSVSGSIMGKRFDRAELERMLRRDWATSHDGADYVVIDDVEVELD